MLRAVMRVGLPGSAMATGVPRCAFGRFDADMQHAPTRSGITAGFLDAREACVQPCERARGLEGDRMVRSLYQRLPEDVRRCLRPLNLVDEMASFLPGSGRARVQGATEAWRRVRRL